jgi:hypothetical protein
MNPDGTRIAVEVKNEISVLIDFFVECFGKLLVRRYQKAFARSVPEAFG